MQHDKQRILGKLRFAVKESAGARFQKRRSSAYFRWLCGQRSCEGWTRLLKFGICQHNEGGAVGAGAVL
jgi:hypothetical protein